MTVKIARMSNDNMTLVSETSHKQNPGGNHKAALNETYKLSAMILHSQFNLEFNLIGWDKNKMKQLRCKNLVVKLLIT